LTDVKLYLGDCLEVTRGFPDKSVDTCITDPPYELGFMGKKWDSSGIAFQPETWQAVYRVLKPGAILLAFGGTRTYHRMVCAIEDAGFEIRDTIAWVYGCLDAETHVATIDGVKPHHKTKIGDLVLCYNPENGEYSYQPILEIVEYEYSDTAYRLVGDLGEQVVSRNHRCIIERGGREVFELAETLQQQASVPFLESLPELRQAIHDGECNAVQDERRAQGIRAWRGHQTSMVRVVPFHYTGKVWCLRVPTGAFVAVRNGVAFPTGNSGFPKSYDISKGIDKQAGADRDVLSSYEREGRSAGIMGNKVQIVRDITAPATPEAQLWHGWGTALKPAMELICVAMKPIDGTYVNNALTWGVAGLWIDGGRVGTEIIPPQRQGKDIRNNAWSGNGGKSDYVSTGSVGRFPANLIHDGSDEVLECFPNSVTKHIESPSMCDEDANTWGGTFQRNRGARGYDGEGSAARFFKQCKFSQEELWQLANIAEKSSSPQKSQDAFVQELAQILERHEVQLNEQALQAILDCIGSYSECIQSQSFAQCAERWANTDTIPTTQNRLKLSGYAQPATDEFTNSDKLARAEQKSEHSRFLYCPKASRSERNAGLEGMEVGKRAGKMMHKANNTSDCPSDGFERFEPKPMQNHHPTVKPIELMRYLVRLTKTPTGGIVLDPFMGSGTTGIACLLEGREFIGIEREEEYYAIAEKRIAEAQKQPRLI